MKFSEKYPNAKPGDKVDYNYIVSDYYNNCMECGRLTNFVDIASEGYLCSEECEKAWYDKFFKACIELPEEDIEL